VKEPGLIIIVIQWGLGVEHVKGQDLFLSELKVQNGSSNVQSVKAQSRRHNFANWYRVQKVPWYGAKFLKKYLHTKK
jgi:hypothetical protein